MTGVVPARRCEAAQDGPETGSERFRPRGSDGYAPHSIRFGRLTYVRVGGDWAYVCPLVDLADRGIVGHSAGRTRDASLVLGAFATLDFPPADVQVFHTDRGGEFDNTRIDEPLDVFGIKRSLPCKGNPYDNAVVESTNRLLKKELVYRNHYTTIEQLRHDLNDYVWPGPTTNGSTPPLDTGVRRNSPNSGLVL